MINDDKIGLWFAVLLVVDAGSFLEKDVEKADDSGIWNLQSGVRRKSIRSGLAKIANICL